MDEGGGRRVTWYSLICWYWYYKLRDFHFPLSVIVTWPPCVHIAYFDPMGDDIIYTHAICDQVFVVKERGERTGGDGKWHLLCHFTHENVSWKCLLKVEDHSNRKKSIYLPGGKHLLKLSRAVLHLFCCCLIFVLRFSVCIQPTLIVCSVLFRPQEGW